MGTSAKSVLRIAIRSARDERENLCWKGNIESTKRLAEAWTPTEKLSSQRSAGRQRKHGVSKGLTFVARIRMRRCLNFREREPVVAAWRIVARHGPIIKIGYETSGH